MSKELLKQCAAALEPAGWLYDFYNVDDELVKDDFTQNQDDIDYSYCKNIRPLYAKPPKRRPLTNDEIIEIGKQARAVEGDNILPVLFARIIEAAHGITND